MTDHPSIAQNGGGLVKRLAEITARAKAATEGPWEAGHLADDEVHCNCRYVFGNDDRMGAVAEISVSEREDGSDGDNPPPIEARANLEFIAHAREDIPYLLSTATTLEHRLEQALGALREIGEIAEKQDGQSRFGIYQHAQKSFQRIATLAKGPAQ